VTTVPQARRIRAEKGTLNFEKSRAATSRFPEFKTRYLLSQAPEPGKHIPPDFST